MNNDMILEIARRYTVPEHSMTFWKFSQDELIAFAQSILDADREKRKPLTDEEMNDELVKANVYQSVTAFARAVERRVNGDFDDA